MTDYSAMVWFQYMYTLLDFTVNLGYFQPTSSYLVLDSMNINRDVVHKCMEDSFDTSGDFNTDNKILREDQKWS